MPVQRTLGRMSTCEVRYLGLAEPTEEKLARFLLDLKPANSSKGTQAKVKSTLTQEEIANMIGTSRETVSRVLATFKRRRWIEMQGSTITISRKDCLQELTPQLVPILQRSGCILC